MVLAMATRDKAIALRSLGFQVEQQQLVLRGQQPPAPAAH